MQTLLIVDDEADIREILAFNLEQAGFTCLQATNGQQALTILAEQNVDLILLDVMMPGMSGFEVARQITDTPIIFLTALGVRLLTMASVWPTSICHIYSNASIVWTKDAVENWVVRA